MAGLPGAGRFVRSPRLAARQLGEEYVVLQLDRQLAAALDPTGRAVLDALREPGTAEEVAARVEAKGARQPQLEAVTGLLAELVGLGLVVPVEGETAAPTGAERGPHVLWAEPLSRAVHQPSPPVRIGIPRCRP